MSSWKPMAFCAAMSRRGSSSMPSAVACGICVRSEEHTSELQSRLHLVCRLLLEKKKTHSDNGELIARRKSIMIQLTITNEAHYVVAKHYFLFVSVRAHIDILRSDVFVACSVDVV